MAGIGPSYIVSGLMLGLALFQTLGPLYKRTNILMGSSRDWPSYKATVDTLAPTCERMHPDILEGCERIRMHGRYMYATCVPGIVDGERWSSRKSAWDGKGTNKDIFVSWNLDTDKVTALELRGFPEGVHRAFHGFDFSVVSPSLLSFYLINHRAGGAVVEKLSHTPGAAHATHLKTITHGLASLADTKPEDNHLHSPNDIFALPGPQADKLDAFYVSNDYYYVEGFWHTTENMLRLPWSWLSYYNSQTGWARAWGSMMGANGLTGDKSEVSDPEAPRRLYVNEVLGGRVAVFHRLEDERTGLYSNLTYVQHVVAGFMPDNPTLSYPSEKDLWIAGFAKPTVLFKHILGEEDVACPGTVARINTKQLGADWFGGAAAVEDQQPEEDDLVDESKLDHAELRKRNKEKKAKRAAKEKEELKRLQDIDLNSVSELVEEVFVDEFGVIANATTTAQYDEVGQALYVTGLTMKGVLRCKGFKS